MEHKYVSEDVPCGLVAMGALGGAAGVATPVISGIVAAACAMTGRDFVAEARTLGRLGLAGKSVPEIRAVVENGDGLTLSVRRRQPAADGVPSRFDTRVRGPSRSNGRHRDARSVPCERPDPPRSGRFRPIEEPPR